MEIISKIIMTVFNFVVQFIGFVLLFYMLCFAMVCIFTQPEKKYC